MMARAVDAHQEIISHRKHSSSLSSSPWDRNMEELVRTVKAPVECINVFSTGNVQKASLAFPHATPDDFKFELEIFFNNQPPILKCTWNDKRTSGNQFCLSFYSTDIKEMEVSSDNCRVGFKLHNSPECNCGVTKLVGSNKQTEWKRAPSPMFVSLDVASLVNFEVRFRKIPHSNALSRLHDEVAALGEMSRSRKRLREVSEDSDHGRCDNCVSLQRETQAISRLREDIENQLAKLQTEKKELEQQLEEIKTVGVTSDFERDFYNPVVCSLERLQKEISAIKKVALSKPGLVPTRTMGIFNPNVLHEAKINEHDAVILWHATIGRVDFSQNDHRTIHEITRRYGEKVANDVIRAWKEKEEFNASAGHPVTVAWHYKHDRELTPSETVIYMVQNAYSLEERMGNLEQEFQKEKRKRESVEKCLAEEKSKKMRVDDSDDKNSGMGKPKAYFKQFCSIM